MYFLDNGSGVSTMPPIGTVSSTTPLWFTESPPSYPGADWFNIVQMELLNVLKSCGIEPDKTKLNQLAEAFSAQGQNFVSFTSAGVYEFVVPAVLKAGRKCWVQVIGGGASGAVGSNYIGGTGGSSGGTAYKLVDLTDVDTVTITVGAGGESVTTINSAGNSGGSSSFGGYFSATGAPVTNVSSSQPGGEGIYGDINLAGFPGALAAVLAISGTNITSCGGNGGGAGGGAGKINTTQWNLDAENGRHGKSPARVAQG